MPENDTRTLLELFGNWSDIAQFAVGDTLLEEGEAGGAMYVILEGEVEVASGATRLTTLGRGEIVGELSLIDDEPCSAAVRAATKTSAARIRSAQFMYLIENHPFFAIAVMQTIANRLRRMNSGAVRDH